MHQRRGRAESARGGRPPLARKYSIQAEALLKREAVESAAAGWTFPTAGAGGLQPDVNLDDREALADLLGDDALP
ncbi:MAG: hypothetical protein WBF86_06720 [Mycobacterium sp.]